MDITRLLETRFINLKDVNKAVVIREIDMSMGAGYDEFRTYSKEFDEYDEVLIEVYLLDFTTGTMEKINCVEMRNLYKLVIGRANRVYYHHILKYLEFIEKEK